MKEMGRERNGVLREKEIEAGEIREGGLAATLRVWSFSSGQQGATGMLYGGERLD